MLNAMCIADLHFGAINGVKLLKELNHLFIRKIEKSDSVNLVVICGDLTDKALSYNDVSINSLLIFINKLAELCEKKEVRFRVIKGTNTHERNQLENYRYLESNPNLDFKIINEMTVEEFNGLKLLYLPENYEIKYSDIPNDIDFCFGHGDINFLNYGNKILDKKNSFQVNKLKKKIKHFGIFGHYHQFKNYEDKIFYIGSFSRWVFGEEERKGFVNVIYDDEDDSASIKFIENKLCDYYKTVDITSYINDEEMDDKAKVRSIMKTIKHFREKYGEDRTKIRVSINYNQLSTIDQIDNSNRIIEMIMKQNNDIKLHIIPNKNMIRKSEEETEKENELKNSEYYFLFSDELTTISKIQKYIKIKYGRKIPIERIQSFLSTNEQLLNQGWWLCWLLRKQSLHLKTRIK